MLLHTRIILYRDLRSHFHYTMLLVWILIICDGIASVMMLLSIRRHLLT